MSRLVCFLACAILGVAMLIGGLLVPAHLRALDVNILQAAGRDTRSLVLDGLGLATDKKLGAAQLEYDAAKREGLADAEALRIAVNELSRQHPGWVAWGGPEPPFESIFQRDPRLREDGSEAFTEYVLRLENRERVLQSLQASQRPLVQELVRTRALTNTTIFPPSQSSSGQAFDAAVSVCGLLADTGHLSAGLSNAVQELASRANRGGNVQPFEELLVDMMSLGQRFNWGRLVVLLENVQETQTLRRVANLVRRAGDQMPVLFSAIHLSGDPRSVANYLVEFSQTGLNDLGNSLRYGEGGVKQLLERNQRLYEPGFAKTLAAAAPFNSVYPWLLRYSWHSPQPALALKWLLYLLAGFFLAAS
ncbi:MAG TPA: hypothetical protein VHI52_19515, partial [Verrucomicrobiae bacterium]|nr:hypothetical protein [Verrucomicrobiae bacterium]